jgi:hypothetical protein
MLVLTLISLAAIRRSGAASTQAHRLSVPTSGRFAGAVQEVRDRWPSAFVIVGTEAWDDLEEAEQLELMRDLATSLTSARYQGALVSNAAGRPLAQWMRSGGASLLDGETERGPLHAAARGDGAGPSQRQRSGP